MPFAEPDRQRTRQVKPSLHFLPLNDCDVSVDGNIGETIDSSTWLWPVNFQPVELSCLSNSQHFARVVAGQKTSSRSLWPRMNLTVGTPLDQGSGCCRICSSTRQAQAQPVVFDRHIVVKDDGGT